LAQHLSEQSLAESGVKAVEFRRQLTRPHVKGREVAGISTAMAVSLDQESPGSSPGGAMKPGKELDVAGLLMCLPRTT
jgi:hypothetical protein